MFIDKKTMKAILKVSKYIITGITSRPV